MAVSHDSMSMEFHIIMEFVDGSNLRSVIYKKPEAVRVDLNDKYCMSIEICQGIHFLYERPYRIIHRDLKPANILVTKEKKINICDMGVSKINEINSQLMTTISSSGEIKAFGTSLYLAPQIQLAKPKDRPEASAATDVWALGCTLIEMFNEAPIWDLGEDNPREKLNSILQNKNEPNLAGVPENLKNIFATSMCYRADDRPSAKDTFHSIKSAFSSSFF